VLWLIDRTTGHGRKPRPLLAPGSRRPFQSLPWRDSKTAVGKG
jgi:hypothetical protein